MQEENAIFLNQLHDLARRSYAQNVYTFTGFLNMEQLSMVLEHERELAFAGITYFGGTQGSERCMVRFGDPDILGYEEDFPIACLRITPLSEKFSEDLSHRDYLGALMYLGIKRSTMGDILVFGKSARVFCTETVADFLCESLTRVRHTPVRCERSEELPETASVRLKRLMLIVPSLRCDVLVAKVYKLPRSTGSALFRAKKVYINARQIMDGSSTVKEDDTVSVRGYGRFICRGIRKETKKGNLQVDIDLYV